MGIRDRFEKETKIAEYYLRHYTDVLEEVTIGVKDVLEASPSTMKGEETRSGSGTISDPTARAAAALETQCDDRRLRWMALIREVEVQLETEMMIVLRIWRKHRHAQGRKSWKAAAEVEFAAEMGKVRGRDHFRSGRTLQQRWRQIVEIAAREAIRKKLL